MKITEELLNVIGSANPDGNLLRLDCGPLPTELYRRVAAALGAVGGEWSKTEQAFVFPGPAWPAVVDLCARDEVETALERKQATQFYATPAEVARRLLVLAQAGPGMEVLEPSAGTGAIAGLLAGAGAVVDCVEKEAGHAEVIRAAGYARSVQTADFLSVQPSRLYDRVVMNPPFTGGQDARHVERALRFVKPGGRLVAIMSGSFGWKRDKGVARVRDLMRERGGWYEKLPAGTFEESGTMMETVIVVIPVPGGPAVDPDAPPGRMLVEEWEDTPGVRFDPVATPPGTYVRYSSWDVGDVLFAYRGDCIGCGAPTWGHLNDRGDDVTGVFGAHTYAPVTSDDFNEDVPGDTEIPRCGGECWNTSKGYERVMRNARALLAGQAARLPEVSRPARDAAVADDRGQLALFGSAT